MAAASSGSAVQPSAADVVARAGLRELSRRNIASLWAGYGSVVEIQTDQGAVMLKHIVAESGTSVSHRRKVASYVNEARFYTDFAGQLLSEKVTHYLDVYPRHHCGIDPHPTQHLHLSVRP